MAAADLSEAEGLTKRVYGKINDVRPEGVKFVNRVKFSEGNRIGDSFNEPVLLTHEHGFTYSADTDGAVIDLNGAESAESQNASLKGTEIILQAQNSYKLYTSMLKQGEAAFTKWQTLRMSNMKMSMLKRLEIDMLYGSSDGGIGIPSAQTDDSGTTQTYSITLASYAPGIWAGLKGAKIDAYDTSGALSKINSNDDITITSITPAKGSTLATVTLTGNETDLDGIASALPDVSFFFKGSQGEQCTGLVQQVTNTGTLHGINGANYELWQGNDVSAGSAALTWELVGDAIGNAVGRGLDQDVVLQVSIPTWSNLNNNLAALRMLDSSYSEGKTKYGSKSIEFHFINGTITVEPSIFQKYGEAMWYVPSEIKRIGSTDVTFSLDTEGNILFHLEGKNAVEMRAYSDQNLLVRKPAIMGRISSIANEFAS